ncbi:zinc finger protein-like 1 [Eriocheir sinensis]|uniref:zinc finger protein-like 1 n=1 Tax=Eriocheir sinensis TaxID=95602 RepID=UPI0021C9F62B|nr:zinc finger protein-like 1 [Eriocheir sinensis]
MGLCKCPKKKVTNQFCFEHATNVCENCMVTGHPRCIIKSYHKWLDSSEYDPSCQVCGASLASGDCVRLVCYDVFHKECLNHWASQLPPNTAPAGYRCPMCSEPVFPAPNLVSPVADYLRETLAAYPWARTGLGLPLIEEKKSQEVVDSAWGSMNGAAVSEGGPHSTPTPHPRQVQPHPDLHTSPLDPHLRPSVHGSVTSSSSGGGVRVTAMEDPPITPSVFRDTHHTAAATPSAVSTSVARKGSSSDTKLLLNEGPDADESENKYKRRSAIEWFSRWWRSMNRPASRHHQGFVLGARRMVILLVVLGCLTLFVVLSYFSRGASDDDPMLDPFNNPNIRVAGE